MAISQAYFNRFGRVLGQRSFVTLPLRSKYVRWFQSNHEGAIIDRIQEAYFDGTEGIVINPGAFTHYSYAIRDALASVDIPKVEVHISDITKREEFRKISVTKDACQKQIYGHGLDGYLEAIDFLVTIQSQAN